jgi:PAS domain S-box-containing protein
LKPGDGEMRRGSDGGGEAEDGVLGRAAFDKCPQPMWVFDAESLRFLAVNDAALDAYGYSREQFLAMTIADIRPAEDRQRLLAALEEAQVTSFRSSHWRHRLADGRVISVEVSSRAIELAGRPARLILAVDVSERLAAEAALQASEQEQRRLAWQLDLERRRLVAAQEVARLGSWETDLSTLDVSWSEPTHGIFETDPRTFSPTHERFLALVHPDDRERVDTAFRESWATREVQTIEHRLLLTSGRVKHVEERWQTFVDADDRPVRAMGTTQDITERRIAEQRLEEQAALLDAAYEAILVKDLDDRILFWSRGAERAYGWTREEAMGRTSVDVLYAGDGAQVAAAMPRLLADGQWQGEMRHRTRDGRERIVDVRWTLVRDSSGAPKSVLSINNDVTERRQLETMLLRTQRLESIGTLAGGIAHDLNNVLAPILMSIELLREEETRGDRLDLLATIASSAQRGADMVRQVLSFARGMHGTKTRMDLRLVGRDVVKILRDTLPKNIEIELRFADELWPIDADPTQMHQVLMNLCVNARDAMPEGGRLTVTIENVAIDETYATVHPDAQPGPYVLLKVADTGVGIPPEHHARLFEPFFTTKETGGGTGLGLPTVHTIVRGHGGFVHVYSEVGRGAKFKIYLPAAAEAAEAERLAIERGDLPRGAGECVLVVDDEQSVREVVRRTLERFGYRVMLAAHGAEAVALYAQHRAEVAVVLTDMSMPVMDGPATILALQAVDPAVRIVGTSGLAANSHVAKAASAGVRHFVPKPYTAETLLRVLRQALEEPA